MATFTRKHAWNNDGTFANSDLLWYAKGVGVMQSRPLADPNSWWFFAAIHGHYFGIPSLQRFPRWDFIPAPPQIPALTLPTQALQDLYWNQCQHQSWYFPPWHRGYLLALEAQIREAVVGLGGPADWALPYWNYFKLSPLFDARQIPPAFTAPTLPDGSPNPLFVASRHGPNWDGVIFISNDANEDCQGASAYTDEYGGPETQFWHSGGTGGLLESNPHNDVHGDVGGADARLLFRIGGQFIAELAANVLSPALRNEFLTRGFVLSPQAIARVIRPGNLWRVIDFTQDYDIFNNPSGTNLAVVDFKSGLMGDPGTAALDPIFYLHHANIDRMWAVWNDTLGNSNPTDAAWLDGPVAGPDRWQFAMPMPGSTTPWEFTPADVNTLAQLDYTYDDLNVTAPPLPAIVEVQRLMALGVPRAAASQARGANMRGGEGAELVGANDDEGALPVGSAGARATVNLEPEARSRAFASMARAAETRSPDRVYLRLENVRGTIDAYKLRVSVNQRIVGTVSLFGLNRASMEDGQHGGAGLTFDFDITDLMDTLFLANEIDVESLDVRIEPNHAFADLAQISVGRISVYRQGVE